ncbi:hypothetical protein NEISICOT_01002 [Neisseria sicca ATCC 29256]|jgi:hypothetical protein|uniref:Uncharacterized protein n=1 Tax=Neisseria sicca ATCC 29256 TaxID=547045 RepID=C6M3B1_NEISI|nr:MULTISPECIES: hypothetical protein [Neisseria]EET45375.1 hypothetical protein NEISICOT_01002 [Neisseria sicca ATCC 29256]QMT38701.1 phosphoribosylglycinamide formyltransferase [Neisseria sicca]
MNKFSTDTKIDKLVKTKIKEGWKVKFGKKHPALIAPNNRRIAIPITPSDCKAFYSFRLQVKQLMLCHS